MKLLKNSLIKYISTLAAIILMLSGCSSAQHPATTAMLEPSIPQPKPVAYNTALWSGNTTNVWNRLLHYSSAKLTHMQQTAENPTEQAWIELALIDKRNSTNSSQLARELIAWRERNPTHPGNQLIPDNSVLNQLTHTTQPQHIAILIPQQGQFSASGQTIREGFLNAYYANLSKTEKQSIKFYDTQTQHIAAVYQQAIADGADFIIGPLAKSNVQELSAGGSITAPTLALNYTDTKNNLPRNLYEYGLLPEDEAGQIADRAHEAGLRRALIIAPQNPWGHRLATAFSNRWQAQGGQIQDAWYFSKQADFNKEIARLLNVNPTTDKKLMSKQNNKALLEQQRRQDVDVIFLFSQAQDSRVIVPLLKFYYAGDIPIYASSSVYAGKRGFEKETDLSGVTVCDIPWNTRMARDNTDEVQADRLYAVGQDAYLLSQNLQRLALLPNFPIYGATGALVLSANQQIHRRLPCTTIQHDLV